MTTSPAFVGQSRRDFLLGAAVVGGSLVIGDLRALAAMAPPPGPSGPAPNPFGAFVKIAPDGVVTVVNKFQDMGQGNHAGVAALVCEEMDADWSTLRWEHAPANRKLYANRLVGIQGTGGSSAISSSFEEMRRTGAAARAMLVQAAAGRWNVPAAEISVQDGVVSHAGSGRKAGFGELVAEAAALPTPQDPPLKDPAKFRLVGTDKVRRKDSGIKATGQAVYTQDLHAPGMLVAMVAHAPRFGGKVKTFDDSAARKVAGVVEVVQIPTGVAVLADNTYAAKKGRDALKIEWDDSSAERRSTDEIVAEYRRIAAGQTAVRGVSFDSRGDASEAFDGELFTAAYDFPYLAHATMEPMNCSAVIRDGRVKLTFGCQGQSWDQAAVGKVLGIAPDAVEIETLFAGGSFGRRASPASDFPVECVEAARAAAAKTPALAGRPVKLVWTREDDMTGGMYRPMVHHTVAIKLDADGYPLAWRHRVVGQPIVTGPNVKFDPSTVEGIANNPYWKATPVVDGVVYAPSSPVTVTAWRSVAANHTAMVMEHTIDQLARRASKDPVAYRRELLRRAGAKRHLGALDLALARSDWGKPVPAGWARTAGVFECFGTVVAQVADVTLANGQPRVGRVVSAVDCGLAVAPDQIAAQIESGTCYGLSAALFGEVRLKEGAAVQTNFHNYRVLRIDEAPLVETHIVPSANPPSGTGEPGVPVIAPLVAAGLLQLTGKPTASLPFVKV